VALGRALVAAVAAEFLSAGGAVARAHAALWAGQLLPLVLRRRWCVSFPNTPPPSGGCGPVPEPRDHDGDRRNANGLGLTPAVVLKPEVSVGPVRAC
jgi:hypothetical protein